MNSRKLVGAVALGLLVLVGLGGHYVAGIPLGDWDPMWSLAYILSLCVASFVAFYDRKNFPEKTWDFNPGRGLLYFFLGWIIFPLMMVIEALSGADFSPARMVVGTFFLSLFIGIVGTFTENVGV